MQERSAILAQSKTISGSKPMSATGNAGPGVAVSAPAQGGKAGNGTQVNPSPSGPITSDFACAKTPDALIFSINGQKKGAVFTTDPDDNLFTLTGCNFGDNQGSIHLYGGFAHGNIPFEISFWNDKSIVARVQPDLAGELDRDNVTLVLVSGNGHQTAFQGYKFYAARQIYPLAGIPNVSGKVILGQPVPPNCELAPDYTFASCDVASPADSLTLVVDRWGVKGDKGTDQLTISGLKPGFEVNDVSLWISPDVKDKQGWALYSFAENISVNYVFGWKNPIATYGLQISVAGPRGIDSVWK
jgi:hypothetical protein